MPRKLRGCSADIVSFQIERVFLHESEPIRPRSERLLEHSGKIGVALYGHDAPRMLEKRDAQRTNAGAHFQHEIVGSEVSQCDDLLQDGIVDEEVLAERVLGRQAVRFQNSACLRDTCKRRKPSHDANRSFSGGSTWSPRLAQIVSVWNRRLARICSSWLPAGLIREDGPIRRRLSLSRRPV